MSATRLSGARGVVSLEPGASSSTSSACGHLPLRTLENLQSAIELGGREWQGGQARPDWALCWSPFRRAGGAGANEARYSHELEIARIIKRPVGTVKARISRGREQLRRKLERAREGDAFTPRKR